MHSSTVPSHLFEHLDMLIRKAKSVGADAADGVYVESMGVSAAIRNGELSTLERSESASLGLRVLIGKKQACVATHDIHPERLNEMVERAVDMARLAPEDPYAGLADQSQLAKHIPDLDLFDGVEIGADQLIASAKTMEEIVRQNPKVTNVEESNASWGLSGFAFVTSHGFAGGYRGTSHGLSIEVVAGSGTHMVRDYDYSSAMHYADLRTPQDVALAAAARTVSRLDARKMPTKKIPVVFAPRVASSLLRNLLGAINGTSIARKASFLIDELGKTILPSTINLIDDPLLKRGLRSRPFDGEGLATQKRAFVEKGVLTGWMMNCSAARQLNLQSTGHASRGVGGIPGISASNFYMSAGAVSPEELIADIKEGFYVTETMGHGGDTLTGDYSQGAAGFWIENGKISFPVHEMTIAGNLKPMFQNLSAANDLTHRYGVDAPTLRIEGMTVAGE
ncbi:MAG: TldD/PmbA family protein [Alphaproteobacteria bacterium]|nr:TldD/PmbA family protein [Alphaproteobacteria bacterium]